MFGYIYVNEQELKLKEYTAYRSFYCGLCRNLHLRYGRTAQMMLNYDLTFLAILLTALYEEKTTVEERRCMLHPIQKHKSAENSAISYAADMCVLLSYKKLKDDWKDEHSLIGASGAALLKKSSEELKKRYPRQGKAIEENIRLLGEAEKEQKKEIDYVAGLTGHFLGEIFVWKEDIWQEDLRQMGFYLGKFIYLMDALEDLPKDRKKNNYNLFLDCGDVFDGNEEPKYRKMLTDVLAESARAFERLPILEYAGILRNVLYSGVWGRYVLIKQTHDEKVQKNRNRNEET